MSVRRIRKYIDKLKKHCKKKCFISCLKYVIYDSQDNIVNINNTGWTQSWNLIDDGGSNPIFAVKYLWNDQKIKIGSDTYTITQVYVNGRLAELEYVDGYWYTSYPDLQVYMNNTDIFYLHIKTN